MTNENASKISIAPIELTDFSGSTFQSKHKYTQNQTNQFGYQTKFFGKDCTTFELEYSIKYDKPDKLPKLFKLLTWNIWGMNDYKKGDKYNVLSELMMLRMDKIVNIIAKEDPDIIVLQEMSYESLGMIKGYMRKLDLTKSYVGYGHNFTRLCPDTMNRLIGRYVDIYVFSKYTPTSITQYNQPTNLGYTAPITIVAFNNIHIVCCHLQAGSKYSPGQEEVWLEYSRSRSEQLKGIDSIIKKKSHDKTVILCGDFNLDLDGDDKEWPELKNLRELRMNDTWRSVHSDKKTDPGFTEDTKINHMRWNLKFMEKCFRYDGILFKNARTKLTAIDSITVGTESYTMDDDMFDDFVKVLSNKSVTGKTRTKTYHPSDHFGVMTTFTQ